MEGSDDQGASAPSVTLDVLGIETALTTQGYPPRKPTQRSAHLTEIDVWSDDRDTRSLASALDGSGLAPFRANRRSGHRFWIAMDEKGWVKVDAKLRKAESRASTLHDLIWLGTRFRGLVVAVRGADGAGKSTAIECVSRTMPIDVVTKYLGIKRRPSSVNAASRMDVGPRRARAWRSYAGFPRWMIQTASALWSVELASWKGSVVLCDRHPIEAGRLGDEPLAVKLAKRVVVRMMTPAPDLLILLSAPGEVLFARKGEHTPAYLDKMTMLWAELVGARQGITLNVDRSPADVCLDLQREIWHRLVPRRAE